MKTNIQISLENCRFFSYHGLYPEEQVLGNEFWVCAAAEYYPNKEIEDNIENTLNYELLYSIINQEMSKPRKLLETVAYSILEKVQLKGLDLERIYISIQKNNPPFGQDQASAKVIIDWKK